MDIITYESPVAVTNEISAPATLTTTETELFRTTDQKFLHKSQLTLLSSVVNAGLTTVTFNFYVTPNPTAQTVLWYPLSLYATATGIMTQRSVLLNSTSYSDGTSWASVDNIPLASCFGFKVAGKSNTGTPAYTLTVLARDN